MCLEVQESCTTKANGGSDLLLRMGINLGDIIIEADGDIYGDGVNVAARLEQIGRSWWRLHLRDRFTSS